MSNESCISTGTVVRREVKIIFISYQPLKTQKHLVSIGLSCSDASARFFFFFFFLSNDLHILQTTQKTNKNIT